jgi:hypothetical protein
MDIVADLNATPPSASLADPDDLGSFKVLARGREGDTAGLAEALQGVATLAEDGHAFVGVDAVRRLAGARARDPEWNAGFDKMLAYAGSKGWMNDAGTAIQAHVDWEPAGPAA